MASPSERQKKIMEHLARSSGNFINPTTPSVERQQRILQHVRLTRG